MRHNVPFGDQASALIASPHLSHQPQRLFEWKEDMSK